MTTITYQQMNDLAGGGLTEQQMDGIAQYFGYTITPAKPPEAMVKDDVERVALAIERAWFAKRGCHDADKVAALINLDEARLEDARAAMVATLELAAADARKNMSKKSQWFADWLQQRANDVKEPGNG
jgi:hypothetical protein